MVRLTSGTASFLVPTGINTVAALVVGGGGGGGFGGNGGGGGAGAVIVSDTGVTATPGTTISGTVGGGGTSGYPSYIKGGKGTDTSLTINSQAYIASGGGGGSSFGNAADDGGSGGGKAINGTGPGNGYNLNYATWSEYVNSGSTHSTVGGGGGGGAGGSPSNASSNGGIGRTIWGYAIGGGGSGWSGGNATSAAPFGGGAPRVGEQSDANGGCNNNGISCNGRVNTGGGGGGGGAGGSGVIVVKFIPSRGQGTIAITNGFQANRRTTFTFTRTGTVPTGTTTSLQWQVKPSGSSVWSNVTTGTGSTTSSYQTAVLGASDNGNAYRIAVTDTSSTYGISTTTHTEVSAQNLFIPPGGETDTAVNTSGTQFFYAPAANSILPGVLSTVTMEAWVNPSATCDGSYFCSILASNFSFILDVYQGKVAYIIGSGSAWCDGGAVTYVANGLVPSGSWTHIAMVRSSANVKIYVNGSLVSNVTSSCSPTTLTASSSQQFRVGSRDLHDQHFFGSIDEVRIWTTDRSASIASDMHSNETSTSGLTNYWNFNEGTGGTAYNQVPSATSSSDLISFGSTKDSPSFWDADSISSASASDAYTVRIFKRSYITASGGWRVPANVSRVTALVVAGGGGAGFNSGGGGSGGGVSFQGSLSVSGNIAVTVGMGGRGATSNGTANAGTSSTFGATNAAGGNGGVGPSGAGGTSVSGSGAGGAGSATSSAAGGNGGNGPTYSITGVSINYAGGGGGGGWIANSVGGTGGSGGGAAGGGGGASSRTGANNNNGASGTPNTGGGGGGGSVSSATSGNGGSGIIIIRWITATAPIFTGPSSDTLTAGMVETFTASNNPNSPLTRNFRWQVSTDTGTTWVNATTGTGLTSANYVTDILETTTSGTRYRYRVVVTDSDTAGLSIVETSTAIVFLTINPRITITGSSVSLTQKYGETQTVTYAIANGTGTRTTAASPNNRTGITWSSVSGSAATLGIGAGLGFGTYYETLTVTDSVTATTTQMFTISISKADTITVTATPSTTTYNVSAITPGYVVSGLKNSETATATSNFLGISGTSYGITTTPPTNAGSYRFTPSDVVLSVGASLNNYQGVNYESATVTINKAFQSKLSVGQYDAFPGISSYPINVYGGTGLGSVTRTLVDTGTANCALSGALILTAANVGTCTVRAVKDGGVNYFAETTTATIYWIPFINRYTNSGPTTPTDLGLSGSTGFEKRTYETFTVLSFANGSGSAVTSAAKNTVMRIIGTGFDSSDETTEVIIGFFSIPKSSLTFNTTNPLANYVEFTLPNSSDLDAGANDVAMKSRKGWAFAPGLLNVTG
jgi:hypothetical protein